MTDEENNEEGGNNYFETLLLRVHGVMLVAAAVVDVQERQV
jgi:hypothetical protein